MRTWKSAAGGGGYGKDGRRLYVAFFFLSYESGRLRGGEGKSPSLGVCSSYAYSPVRVACPVLPIGDEKGLG